MKAPEWLRRLITASSRAQAADVFPHHRTWGVGQDWSPPEYGEYYATSPAIYAAIHIRANALTRAPLTIFPPSIASATALPPTHPLAALMNTPNPHMVGPELIQAIEINLCLWGKAFLSIETVAGRTHLNPIRPDRLYTLSGDLKDYIAGYIYRAATGKEVAYLPDEIVTFNYFNPLQDRTGMPPIAPLRLTADMAHDAAVFNRKVFQNGGVPDFMLFAIPEMTTQQVEAYYEQWEKRYAGPAKAHRPAIAAGITDMKLLAFNQRDMEYTQGLNWSIEEVARVYGVPQPMLGSLRESTLANVESLERILWRTTIVPEATMLAATLTHRLNPMLGYLGYRTAFDFSQIDALTELEEPRLKRETAYLDRGVMTINEVRASRGLTPLPGGNDPQAVARMLAVTRTPTPTAASLDLSQRYREHNGEHPSGDHVP